MSEFLGVDGLAYLLIHLSIGPIKYKLGQGSHCDAADIDEFVDFFRRVQMPYYEEARKRFANPDLLADFADANELLPYLTAELKKIVETYPEQF